LSITFDLSGMKGPTSSCASATIALSTIWPFNRYVKKWVPSGECPFSAILILSDAYRAQNLKWTSPCSSPKIFHYFFKFDTVVLFCISVFPFWYELSDWTTEVPNTVYARTLWTTRSS
jgi:hypothetical protein